MTTENDWFMRQIKGAANMLGSALHLTIQHLDLGQFEDEQGRQLDGAAKIGRASCRERV